MGILKKRGGVYPNPTSIFLLFLTWEIPPKKVLKKHVIPKQGGGGGGPDLGKIPTFSRVFFTDVPKTSQELQMLSSVVP